MMERKKAIILLLVLQLSICCDGQTSQSLCKVDTCYVSADDIFFLGEMIHSNQLIILTSDEINVDESSGFIVIENVSNLTISGGESGSLIECFEDSTFGLYFKNTTNVILTRLRIKNCGSFVPKYLLPYTTEGIVTLLYLKNYPRNISCLTSLLIEMSRNMKLSMVHIENSPKVALTIIDYEINESSKDPMLSVHPCNRRLTHDTMHNSFESSMIPSSLLLENSVIANSPTGILSRSTSNNILIKNVEVINCSLIFLWGGHVTVRENLTMNSSSLYMRHHHLHVIGGRILFYGNSKRDKLLQVIHCQLFIKDNSEVTFKNIPYRYLTIAFVCSSNMTLHRSTVTFTGITRTYRIFDLHTSYLNMVNNSSLIITNISMDDYCAFVFLEESRWTMEYSTGLFITNNHELSINFLQMNASIDGQVRIANNTIRYDCLYGVLFIKNSSVVFHGSLEVVENREYGAITASNSDLFFINTAIFSDNYASNGGAITLISSFMYVSVNATVVFTRNFARWFGGAIYISKPRRDYATCGTFICSIRVQNDATNCQWFSITFNQNKAGIAGNAIYGGYTSVCFPSQRCRHCYYGTDIYVYNGVNDSSDLSNFTSDPTRVCFCENGIPDCFKVHDSITVHPGEYFNLSVATVGYGLGSVPGSVIAMGSRDMSEGLLFGNELQNSQEVRGTECQDVRYSVVSERDIEQVVMAVEMQSFLESLNDASISISQLRTFKILSVKFFHIPIFLDVHLLPCPVGFQLVRGKCDCHQILLDNNIDACFFSNGTGHILRLAPYWIGLPNHTNLSVIVHPHCPLDYCQSKDISITAEFPNTQCQYQRSGVLCGSCREGLSMILGSSECKKCSNSYLGLVGIFILAGIVLVVILSLLNMTVSVGTLNGLILFANILQANHTTFLPSTTYNNLVLFFSTFIAWLNLDLGIPTCFFDGLTTYIKTWLQFLFPLYILALVGVIIIASKYSIRLTELFGSNAVSVLATLVLLSYTKILRILITVFSFTTLTGSQGYHSVVWLADGNIKYFEPKHAILFLVALLVLLLLGVPYTLILTAAPWIQRSRFLWVSSLYNKFKPLFDAYMGPYKDSCRYWTGMLLLVRVVLIVLFSSISNTNTVAGPQLNLLFLSIASSLLLAFTSALRPYKNKLLNKLEIFHLIFLLTFSFSNFYFSNLNTKDGPRTYIYTVLVGISFLVLFGVCISHIWYRVKKTGIGRRSEPPEREEEEWHPLWQRARITAEDEDKDREVSILTAGATNTISYRDRRESLEELIADNAQTEII